MSPPASRRADKNKKLLKATLFEPLAAIAAGFSPVKTKDVVLLIEHNFFRVENRLNSELLLLIHWVSVLIFNISVLRQHGDKVQQFAMWKIEALPPTSQLVLCWLL